jgi:hypothetical protein
VIPCSLQLPEALPMREVPDPLLIKLEPTERQPVTTQILLSINRQETSGAGGVNRYYSLLSLHYIFRSQLLRPVLPQYILPRWANLVLKTCTLPEPSPVIEACSIPAPTFVNSNVRSSPKPPLLVLQSMPVALPDPLLIKLEPTERQPVITQILLSINKQETSGAGGVNRYYSLLNIALFSGLKLLRPVLPQCIYPRWANLVLKTCTSYPYLFLCIPWDL